MATAMEDAGLAAELSALGDALRARRPELGQRQPGVRMSGGQPLGLGDATSAVADLADLSDLESALGQDYAGANLDDVDEEAVRRALGRQAVDDLQALRRLERELQRQGYLASDGGNLELTPKAVRQAGRHGAAPGLRRPGGRDAVRRSRPARRLPRRATPPGPPGSGSSATSSRSTCQGRSARRCCDRPPRASAGAGSGSPRRTSGSPRPSGAARPRSACWSTCRTRWRCAAPGAVAKQTALALHALLRSKYPQDAIQVVGFSNYARELHEDRAGRARLDMVQGTNLHHALMIAGRHLDKHPEARAGGADRHRRRADRAPDAGRQAVVRLAARAGDDRADAGRGGQDDQAARRR